jgi:hypothetical protein
MQPEQALAMVEACTSFRRSITASTRPPPGATMDSARSGSAIRPEESTS